MGLERIYEIGPFLVSHGKPNPLRVFHTYEALGLYPGSVFLPLRKPMIGKHSRPKKTIPHWTLWTPLYNALI